ncbi:hypothetical protein [Microcoleus sp. Pol12A5]|uniref:hypothetical protein n=1 Tax=Microcoleus sp. Pol12A5 TaxID=3055392 RepID=UPI002FD0B836
MPSEDEVFGTQNKRLEVLNTIYDLEIKGVSGITNSHIARYKNIQDKELYDILKFLIDEGLISEISSIEGLLETPGYAAVRITNKGIRHVDPIKDSDFVEFDYVEYFKKRKEEHEARVKAQEELVASPAYQSELKHIRRMTYDISNVLRICLIYSQRAGEYFKNSLMINCTDDIGQSLFAVLHLVEEGLINPAKRELRYIIENIVKNLYVDQCAARQKPPFPELTERLAFLKNNVNSTIDVRNQLKLTALPSDKEKQLIDDIYNIYRDCCAYVHVSREQIEERLKAIEKGRPLGFETAKELKNIGRLMFRVYDIVLTLYFHGCGMETTGDVFINHLDDLTTWKFHKGKYVSIVSAFFNYKYERNIKKYEERKLWSPRRN